MNDKINIDDLSHDELFEIFESIPSDCESIIGDESDFEEDVTDVVEVFNIFIFIFIFHTNKHQFSIVFIIFLICYLFLNKIEQIIYFFKLY